MELYIKPGVGFPENWHSNTIVSFSTARSSFNSFTKLGKLWKAATVIV